MSTRKDQGDRAEELVARWLHSQGAHIVARNLRLGHLELDIVARHNELVLVVEVRTRSSRSFTSGLSSIDHKKRLRLRAAGELLWRRRYRNDSSVQRLRFDVATVSFESTPPAIEYVTAAL